MSSQALAFGYFIANRGPSLLLEPLNLAHMSGPRRCLLILLVLPLCGLARADPIERPIRDDVIYFVLLDRFSNAITGNDTGGYGGDKNIHGFDPIHKGYYHGGDLKGLIARLDYLKGMGITAIWMGPIFKNKPVQGDSAGYHGYWTTDFTKVDPHFGSNEDLKALVEQAHQRGIKIFFDIVVNHTADVIKVPAGQRAASRGQ